MAGEPAGTNGTCLLADGRQMPLIGLGVWQVPDGPQCENAVRWALESGYRHIDTAQAYGNEESVGRALRASGVPREQIFITTKFAPARRDPAAELEQSLRRLGVDFVDLYLVHWPRGGPTRAWPGMERALARGYSRSIGVSNFSVADLDSLREVASVAPVVNQVQFNPFHYRRALLDACRGGDVVLEAYSPLGTGRHLKRPTIVEVAAQVRHSPAQVLLRWCIQHRVPAVTKSTRRERIEENARIDDFTLCDEQLSRLDACDETGGTDRALESPWW
jgi:2,5-diketo-D-gluconate reductase A